MKKILFLSYDGMTDPLGQSQVIPYLEGLSKSGFRITILSFEKKDRFKKNESSIRQLLDKSGIQWEPLFFSVRPPLLSKLYDAWQMKRRALLLHKQENFSFIHCRSYVAAEAGVFMKRRKKIPFLFDMRGFWVDERVDNGQWDLSNPLYNFIYKRYKSKERVYFNDSAHVISLTKNGKEELVKNYGVSADKITVIPCCADLGHFDYNKIKPEDTCILKKQLAIGESDKVITYLGSLGGWYLLNEMLDFFSELKKKIPMVKFLFITHDAAETILSAAQSKGINPGDIIVKAASRNEVPVYLSLSDWSIFFIKDAYSKKGSSPTKQGEIMAMGIPIVCNDVGDTGRIIDESGAGVKIKEFSDAAYQIAIENLLQFKTDMKPQIRESACKYFDLQEGTAKYLAVYKRMA